MVAATGISIEWLREQIAGCAADFKLLLIDACHAGSEKGNDDKSAVAASELGKDFENLEKVVTLASSRADQVSQTQIGVGYIDDCLILALNYITDYAYSGSVSVNHTYMMQISLRTLGGNTSGQTSGLDRTQQH